MRNNYKQGKKAGRAIVALTMVAALTVPVIGNGLFSRSGLSASAASYTSEYETKKSLTDAQHALNQKIVEEGVVLLKNKGGALPLQNNDKKVTVFHSYFNPEDWSQSEGWMVLSGGGSGNIWTGKSDCEGTETTHGCHTIYNGLDDHGFTYNKAMHAEYLNNGGYYGATFCDANGPKMDIVRGQESTFANHDGTAIITVSRIETESQDNYEPSMNGELSAFERDPQNPEKHYLQLRDKEKELIEYAKTKFGKVVVLLNTASPMEVDYLQTSDSVDAVLWVGYPGESGLKDIPGVLDGSVSPSGRTVDTWAKDMTKDPTWQNFGDNSQTNDTFTAANTVLDKDGNVYYVDKDPDAVQNANNAYHSVDYAEGVYLGYRYYETKSAIEGEGWYEANVTYPFGYGLSYTTFTQSIKSHTESGDSVSIIVEVTNTGSVAGKEVVQVYYNPPYTEGGIEKATANLVAFDKTDVIEAGQSAEITITFDKRDMASWDLEAGNYVLEDGAYEISVNKDSHNAWDKFTYNHAEDTRYTTDGETDTAYTKLFSGNDMFNVDKSKYSADGAGVDFMSRATGLQLPETAGNVRFSDEALRYLDSQNSYLSTQDKDTDPWVIDAKNIPSEWTQAADTSAEEVTKLFQMSGVEDEAKWTAFMNQLTWDEMKALVSTGLFQTAALDRIGKPKTFDTDGPAQIGSRAGERGYGWCSAVNISSTWNEQLAEQFGVMIGEEAIHPETNKGVTITGWYGPGMNIHRNPYNGRNFEYYSEDGLLAGKIAAGTVKGAASKGLITYLKHLALNNQETNRTTNGGVCTWTNEQAMREIYLKPFELAVKEGGATGMMCAFNRIGGVPAGANYNLFVNLLEKEWGFDGLAVTDYYEGSSWGWPGNMVVRCHMFPMGDYSAENKNRQIDGTWDADKNRPVVDGNAQDALYYAVRTTAQRMLKTVANSNAVTTKNGVLPDKTYTVIQGHGIGYYPFGAFGFERDVDILAIEGKTGASYELAPGTTFHSPSGDFVGEFTKAGTYEFNLNVNLNAEKWGNLKGESWTSKLTYNVLPAFKIEEKTLNGKVDALYNAQIKFITYDKEYGLTDLDGYGGGTMTGIRKDKQWTKAEGLPAGVELLPSGKLSGIPEEAGTYNVKAYYDGKFEFEFTIEIAEKFIVRTEFKTEDGKLWYKHNDQGDDAWQVVLDLDEFKEEILASSEISISDDGYWVIGGVKTEFKAVPDPVVIPPAQTPDTEDKGGCNGSIGVASVAITSAVLLLAGAVVHIARSKNKD